MGNVTRGGRSNRGEAGVDWRPRGRRGQVVSTRRSRRTAGRVGTLPHSAERLAQHSRAQTTFQSPRAPRVQQTQQQPWRWGGAYTATSRTRRDTCLPHTLEGVRARRRRGAHQRHDMQCAAPPWVAADVASQLLRLHAATTAPWAGVVLDYQACLQHARDLEVGRLGSHVVVGWPETTPRVLRAAARPHVLAPGGDGEGGAGESTCAGT